MSRSPDPGLVGFVRDVLGCGCPEDVVSGTVIDRSPAGEPGLDVGGRLLVRVLASDDLDRLLEVFPEDVIRLRAERDERGFNRVRMVVAHPEFEVLGPILDAMLEVIVEADDRTHVHAVDPDDLPRQLMGSDAGSAA